MRSTPLTSGCPVDHLSRTYELPSPRLKLISIGVIEDAVLTSQLSVVQYIICSELANVLTPVTATKLISTAVAKELGCPRMLTKKVAELVTFRGITLARAASRDADAVLWVMSLFA
jgi:hypothetical protein